MQITSKLAKSIVDEIGSLTNYNINFMNEEGQIIASKDQHRIGDFHEGALKVLESKEKIIVKENTEMEGSKPGINLPVYLNNQIIGVIGITGNEHEVEPLGEVIKKMTEILVKEAYLEQQTELERRAKNTFINEWLNGNVDNKKIFASRGWMHGINVHLPRVVIVMDSIDINTMFYHKSKDNHLNVKEELYIQSLRNKIYHTIEDFLKYEPQNILYMSNDSKYIILHTIGINRNGSFQKDIIKSRIEQIAKYIKEKFDIEISAGIGRYHPEVEGIFKSYKEAKRALDIAKKQNKLLFYEQLGIESFIEEISQETKQEFVERVFPFYKDQREMEKVVQTLVTFFHSNQSLDESSTKLYIHKNTLQYRLKRIKELTGYDPRKFMDGVMLYVALSFYLLRES